MIVRNSMYCRVRDGPDEIATIASGVRAERGGGVEMVVRSSMSPSRV